MQNKFHYCTKQGNTFKGNAADEIQQVFTDYLTNCKEGRHEWIREATHNDNSFLQQINEICLDSIFYSVTSVNFHFALFF